MALILNIDTALEHAGVCVAENGEVLSLRANNRQTDHARWLHTAIREVLLDAGRDMHALQAVAVTSGPGSYTGLRVGMAAAKGLCYALRIPMITESTLLLIADSVSRERGGLCWMCPMIDARRMEVYTVVYDQHMQVQQKAAAMVLDEHSFQHILDRNPVVFSGNGSVKWQSVCRHPNALFSPVSYEIGDLARHSAFKFEMENFANVAYSEPSYLKNVYVGIKDA